MHGVVKHGKGCAVTSHLEALPTLMCQCPSTLAKGLDTATAPFNFLAPYFISIPFMVLPVHMQVIPSHCSKDITTVRILSDIRSPPTLLLRWRQRTGYTKNRA
ncbi:hypothetical protein P280DRAFT_199374 [Massarina eburnea CBS 473.64]|uniref:Uncharacterized protein n=1 Tax=Massarina eburnea CBS 473.64 TaxID=1395130 RepID=A0A6A6RJ47_9PLEO|nr:hypothetical protein P280DRAFT_199374 [Massarina eburnea CBS 473.64]